MLLKFVPLTTLALAAGLLATPASAAPAPAAPGVTPPTTSLVQQAAWRRCWWHHGHRHCRWYGGWEWYHDQGYRHRYGRHHLRHHRHHWRHRHW
jgi:hypothetical protein